MVESKPSDVRPEYLNLYIIMHVENQGLSAAPGVQCVTAGPGLPQQLLGVPVSKTLISSRSVGFLGGTVIITVVKLFLSLSLDDKT